MAASLIDPRFLRYLELIDSVIYVIEIHGGAYTPKWVSPNIKKVFGYSIEEALEPTWWWEHIHPEDYGPVVKRQEKLLKDHTLQHKYRLRRKDGTYLWVLDKLGFYPYDHGGGGEIIGALTDVSNEVHLEKRLKESEERFRLAFHTNPDAMTISRVEDGMIVDVNDGFCRMFGFEREEVLGSTTVELGIWVNLKERNRLKERILEVGTIMDYETTFRKKDGTLFTALSSATLFYLRDIPYVLSVTRDIEDIKQINKELERRERMLTNAQHMAKVGCWELDIRENRLWWSDEVYRIFEVEKEGFKATYEAFLSTVHPEDRSKVDKAYRDSLRLKAPYSIEHRLLFPDGRIKWVEEQCETCFDKKGEPVRSIGTVLDVTEKKLAYLALKESEERYKYLFHNSPMPLFEVDFTQALEYVEEILQAEHSDHDLERFFDLHPNHLSECVSRVKILEVNQAAIDLYGARDKDELLKRLRYTFSEKSYEILKHQIVSIYKGIEQLEVEAELKTFSDETRHVLVRFSWRRIDAMEKKDVVRAVVSLTDVTPLKDAQMSLKQRTRHVEALLELERALLEARGLQDIIEVSLKCLQGIIYDADRISIALIDEGEGAIIINSVGLLEDELGAGKKVPISYVYPAMERLMKGGVLLRDASSLEQDAGDSFIVNKLKASGINTFFNCPIIVRGKPYGSLNFGFKDRSKFNEAHIEMAKGVANTIAIAIEKENLINKLKRSESLLEKRVEERTAQLLAANRELEAFAHSVSHDLRAPLRAIDGFSRLLFDGYGDLLDEEGKRLLNVVRRNAQIMGQFIDDLLRLSKVSRKEMKFSEIDMKGMALSIYYEITTEEERRRIEFHLKDMPRVKGDPSLMRHVFSNLLSNAIKFSRPRAKPVIEVGATDGRDGMPVFYVKDNGVGFNMCVREKLFEIFKRFHSSDQFEGTGVGLSIVERIIKRHGGEIKAEGTPGKGATFYFTIPKVTK